MVNIFKLGLIKQMWCHNQNKYCATTKNWAALNKVVPQLKTILN